MESMRKRMKIELTSSPQRVQKLINNSTFKNCTRYTENLVAISLNNKIINFCKPIYIGFAVLEISKTLMFDYHYNVMKKHYKDKIHLMYTDTGIYYYHIFIFIIYYVFIFIIVICRFTGLSYPNRRLLQGSTGKFKHT